MVDIESKLPLDVAPASDTDSLLGPITSPVMRYLAAIAMIALATVVAIGVDSKIAIPNLSLVFVVPVIIAGVSLGLGPALCSAILGALAFNFFFIDPRYSLAVDDVANIWAIGLLFGGRPHCEWRCLHLWPEGDRGGLVKKAGDGAAKL
ncbi:DUF4118 domain-containing protein [Bradyrhizobium sp. AUGA SZCCT0158]|uniref:DUF4118 domain-containing protein n=1 Tax=Bradyrhizobium sp. AUGA SZCCT0158 TaxID=2807661 RepID=UPI002010FDD8|nr:DUF4118 domain-containing protein [Bradyrhizobium sp. AUGA SZCCT0158]